MSASSITTRICCENKTFTDPNTGEKRNYNEFYILAYDGKVKIYISPKDKTAKDLLLSLYG